MGENTKIEWCDHTWNPWEGCTKVGPGCDHCYAETRNARYGGGVAPNWGPGAPRRRTSPANWRKPLKWNREAAAFAETHGRKQRVFCSSLADVFDNAVDPQWRFDLFALIDATPNLDWLLLTKRIGNVIGMLADMGRDCLPVHVWFGATVVNQTEADRDVPKLLATPAAVRFLSCEPLLGPLTVFDMDGPVDVPYFVPSPINWVIAGGESGPGARPMHPDWARGLRDQCAAAGVAFHFKQWGEWLPCEVDRDDYGRTVCYPDDGSERDMADLKGVRPIQRVAGQDMWRVGKKRAGRLLDGVTHDGFPG